MPTEEGGGTVVPNIPLFCTGLNYNTIDVISALNVIWKLYHSNVMALIWLDDNRAW